MCRAVGGRRERGDLVTSWLTSGGLCEVKEVCGCEVVTVWECGRERGGIECNRVQRSGDV